jgi:competence protein ComEA
MIRALLAIAIGLASQLACAALNLNTATREELVALSGIGPAKAQAIIDYRTQHGGFKTVEELKDVKGIGARRFERLKSEITVAPAAVKTAVRQEPKAAAAPETRAHPPSPALAPARDRRDASSTGYARGALLAGARGIARTIGARRAFQPERRRTT